jgi:WD40 repeat protein
MAGSTLVLACLASTGVLALGLRAVPATAQAGQAKPEPAVTYLDLQPKTNHKLKDTFGESFKDNTLDELKQGKQTLEGFKFNIGEGVVRLANEKSKDKMPEKVEGIKVGAKFARLHILHATEFREAPDTVIGKYIVRYADKTTETIDIAYGQDVMDWWNYPDTTAPTRGKVVWKGANDAAKGYNATLWLFAHTWKNPHPNKPVASIDLVSTLTECAPFVVAMTVAGPSVKDVSVGKDGVRYIEAGNWVQSLAYCAGGKKLAAVQWNGVPQTGSEAGSVVLWDVSKGQLDQTLERFDKGLQFWRVTASKDGKIVAASATHFDKADYGAIRVWDITAGKVLHTFDLPAQVRGALAVSPDGKQVAGGTGNTPNGEVCVWDVQSGTLLKKLKFDGMEYHALALSDDGKWIAAGGRVRGDRGKVVVWDLETAKLKYEWTDNFMLSISAVEFAPGGKLLAGAGPNNSETRVWDMETGKLKHMLKGHEAATLAFAPDGKTLATGGTDHKVILWDVTNWTARHTFEMPNTISDRRQVIAHAFSPDGRTVAAGCADGAIRFWPLPQPGTNAAR